MSEDTGLSLTALDKVLLHLKDNWHHRNDKEFPAAMTQKGISDATNLRLTHVPRTIKALAERELVMDLKGHVKGEKRRYKVYSLTEKGLGEANALVEHLRKQTVCGEKISDILARDKCTVFLPFFMELAGETAPRPSTECMLVGDIPCTEGFVDRQAELEHLGQLLTDPNSRVMIIYGSEGYGTSTLAAKFLDTNKAKWSAAWVPMHKSLPKFRKELEKNLGQLIPELETESPEELASQLDGAKIILVMDNYFEATDDLVDYLAGFIKAIKDIQDFNLLVTARESTPSYERFYTIMDIHDLTVGEVHIRGLDADHAREMLGTPDIDPEALKRLLMFTMGKPATLKLLAEGDPEELKKHTRFKPEEINLMLILKGQTV